MKERLKIILPFLLKIIAIFYGIKMCFWAMNKASTIANVTGFICLIIIGTYFFYEVKNIINKNK